MSDAPDLGLRERKRLAAMRRIQTVALDLFEELGFDEVTIERIADEAEVSASSVYRYFGTKERLVIWDEYDPVALAAISERLGDNRAIDAVRDVIAEVMGEAVARDRERIERRLRLAYRHPSIEAASTLEAFEMAALVAHVIATSADGPVDDLDVQVFAHAFVGGLVGALRHWNASGFTTPFEEVLERPLAVLEHGLEGLSSDL